ncbi:MAG: hypothetical protein JWO03_153 [Bacteroidetes bacterium]|nr:hypothetical protein [Bacteroidota bacterium]
MNVVLKPEAEETIFEVSEFVDSVNTEGSGNRWIDKISTFLLSYARSNVQYVLCRDESLATEGLSCITFNGWIIAFKIEEGEFVVYQLIRGSILI